MKSLSSCPKSYLILSPNVKCITNVMGPHQDNKYMKNVILPGGIMLLVSITCNSSHHLCLHCVGHRTNLPTGQAIQRVHRNLSVYTLK